MEFQELCGLHQHSQARGVQSRMHVLSARGRWGGEIWEFPKMGDPNIVP